MTENEAIFNLSGTEIKVLLSGLGYENVMGIFSEEKENEPQYSKIINVILNLVNQGIVRFDEGKMYVDDNLSDMLCRIGDSKCSFSVTFPASSSTLSGYFSDTFTVICESMVYQNDRYIIRCCSKTELFEDLFGHEDMGKIQKMDSDISEENLWNGNLYTIVSIDIFRKFEHYAEICVCSHAFGVPEIVTKYTNGSEKSLEYTKENFFSLLNSMTLSE